MNESVQQRLQQEVDEFLVAHPALDEFEVLATDISGQFFGKRYPIAKLSSFARDGLAFPASMFVLSIRSEQLPGIPYGLDDGDPDAHFYLVPGSLCVNNWGNKPRGQVLATTSSSSDPSWYEPRFVLQRVADALAQNNWKPMVAFELEFYLFDGHRDDNGLIQLVRNPKTGRADSANVLSSSRIADFEQVIDDIIGACASQGIETGAISSELGPGQYEINFNHHNDVLRAADETCLFKRTVVEVAKKHGMTASFIAKPMLEHAGNGLHMHISMIDDMATTYSQLVRRPTRNYSMQ